MSNKIVLIAFTLSLIFVSFTMMSIPQASALNQSSYDNSHVTARFASHMKVCGDHVCSPGERSAWEKAVWDNQKISQGKVSNPQQHGGDVMHKMAGSTTAPTTMHGNVKMSEKIGMSGNMTGNIPKGTK